VITARPGAAWIALGVIAASCAAACSSNDDAGPPAPAGHDAPTTEVTAEAAADPAPTVSSVPQTTTSTGTANTATSAGGPGGVAGEWVTPGADLFNTRTAVGSSIDSTNVAELAVAWRRPLPDVGGLSTVPLVVADVVYVQGSSGQVVALARETGAVLWASEPTGFNIGPFGVAVDDDRVFALDGSTGVLALDRSDGTRIWATDITATDTTGIDIQPVVVDGTVIASSVPVSISGIYSPGDRGVIHALDAETGAPVWAFDTVEGDLWGHPEVNSGGGAWYPPAVDVDARVVFVGVANPAPFPGTAEWPNGSSRPGPNLYTDSLVALDLDTGALRWYHQVTPHDIFDRDQVHALVATLADGTTVVVSAGKSGVVVGLDPDTGDARWETEVGFHLDDDLTELAGPTTIAPGTYGGVITPPATADGVVYLAVLNAPAELRPDETAYFGAPLGVMDGQIVAVDAADGHVVWSTDVPGDPLGGTAVVNDLVLTALTDGRVLALDRDDGTIVWEHQAAGGINGWLSIAGDDVVVPVGSASPAEILVLRLP
jgi:outer membrane protein assembly factor BamB